MICFLNLRLHQVRTFAPTFRGLYSSFDREKRTYRKLPFFADLIENWAPFIENSILTIFTDPKAKKSENVLNN